MNNSNTGTSASALVAVAITALIGAIAVTGIIMYRIDDFLKIWSAISSLVGIVTGAFVTYFFAQGAVQQATQQAQKERTRADILHQALTATAAEMNPGDWNDLKARNDVIGKALSG